MNNSEPYRNHGGKNNNYAHVPHEDGAWEVQVQQGRAAPGATLGEAGPPSHLRGREQRGAGLSLPECLVLKRGREIKTVGGGVL